MKVEKTKITVGKIIFTILYILIFPVFLLFLSDDWLWVEGWIFSTWFTTLCLTSIIYLYRKDPALLAERYQKPGTANQKEWDKYVVYGLVIGFILWIVIIPLDAKRYGWTTFFPAWLKIAGGIVLILSFILFYRSYTDNTFLSPLVRIQTERKQQVVSTGVYGFVRHPMYLGRILMFIGAPLLLGSSLGVALGLIITVLLAFRTLGEEQMLLKELEGYEEYKRNVRFRFIPYVW